MAAVDLSGYTVMHDLIIQSAFTIRNGRGPEFYFYACLRLLLLKLPGQGNEQAYNSIFDSDSVVGWTMLPILYSQPFRSSFCKIQNLDTEGFQLAGPLLQHSDLMRDSDVGKVRIDSLYNLIIVIAEFLKLKIKVVQPGDKLRL